MPLVAARGDAGVELARLLFEARDLERQRRRALDQRGVPGLRVGGAAAGRRRAPRGARRAPRARVGEARLDHLALAGEPGDRVARFVGADVELAPFFLVARPLVAAQLLAAGQPIELLAGARDVQLVLQDRLLLAVALAVERRRGARCVVAIDRSSSAISACSVSSAVRAVGQLGAEVADLAPRRQDAVAVLARCRP